MWIGCGLFLFGPLEPHISLRRPRSVPSECAQPGSLIRAMTAIRGKPSRSAPGCSMRCQKYGGRVRVHWRRAPTNSLTPPCPQVLTPADGIAFIFDEIAAPRVSESQCLPWCFCGRVGGPPRGDRSRLALWSERALARAMQTSRPNELWPVFVFGSPRGTRSNA